jgi:hypothetical protein
MGCFKALSGMSRTTNVIKQWVKKLYCSVLSEEYIRKRIIKTGSKTSQQRLAKVCPLAALWPGQGAQYRSSAERRPYLVVLLALWFLENGVFTLFRLKSSKMFPHNHIWFFENSRWYIYRLIKIWFKIKKKFCRWIKWWLKKQRWK